MGSLQEPIDLFIMTTISLALAIMWFIPIPSALPLRILCVDTQEWSANHRDFPLSEKVAYQRQEPITLTVVLRFLFIFFFSAHCNALKCRPSRTKGISAPVVLQVYSINRWSSQNMSSEDEANWAPTLGLGNTAK